MVAILLLKLVDEFPILYHDILIHAPHDWHITEHPAVLCPDNKVLDETDAVRNIPCDVHPSRVVVLDVGKEGLELFHLLLEVRAGLQVSDVHELNEVLDEVPCYLHEVRLDDALPVLRGVDAQLDALVGGKVHEVQL